MTLLETEIAKAIVQGSVAEWEIQTGRVLLQSGYALHIDATGYWDTDRVRIRQAYSSPIFIKTFDVYEYLKAKNFLYSLQQKDRS